MKIRDLLSLLCGYQGEDVQEGFMNLYRSFGIPETAARDYMKATYPKIETVDSDFMNAELELRSSDSTVQNNTVEGKTGEFRIVGPIVPAGTANFFRSFGEEATSARDLRDFLAEHEGDVTLRFNSPGGIVTQAAEMVSLLAERQQKAKVTAIVDGMAASAAAILFLAAKERLVSEYGRLMFHRSHIALLVQGNVNDIQRAAESVIQQMDSFDKLQIAAYQRVTGADDEAARAVFDKDTWFNQGDALENKLATGKAFESEPKASTEQPPEAQAIENASRDLMELFELASFIP